MCQTPKPLNIPSCQRTQQKRKRLAHKFSIHNVYPLYDIFYDFGFYYFGFIIIDNDLSTLRRNVPYISVRASVVKERKPPFSGFGAYCSTFYITPSIGYVKIFSLYKNEQNERKRKRKRARISNNVDIVKLKFYDRENQPIATPIPLPLSSF